MCVSWIRKRFRSVNLKRLLVSFGISGLVILGGGIPLIISYGVIAFLSYSAIVVALLATYVSIRSLKLTRKMIRPFLSAAGEIYIDIGETEEKLELMFCVRNSGALPASEVHWDIDFFGEKEEIAELNSSNKYEGAKGDYERALIFPNSVYLQCMKLI